MYDDLVLKYKEFDFESAIRDIQEWQNGLGSSLEDEITYDVLQSVKDIIFDYCIFE